MHFTVHTKVLAWSMRKRTALWCGTENSTQMVLLSWAGFEGTPVTRQEAHLTDAMA